MHVVGRLNVVWPGNFKGGIVVNLGRHAVLQFCQRHFKQMHHEHLLLSEALCLNLFLRLCLNEILCHNAAKLIFFREEE